MPNLESAWWVSFIGVFTSLTYSFIALSLGIKYVSAHECMLPRRVHGGGVFASLSLGIKYVSVHHCMAPGACMGRGRRAARTWERAWLQALLPAPLG